MSQESGYLTDDTVILEEDDNEVNPNDLHPTLERGKPANEVFSLYVNPKYCALRNHWFELCELRDEYVNDLRELYDNTSLFSLHWSIFADYVNQINEINDKLAVLDKNLRLFE